MSFFRNRRSDRGYDVFDDTRDPGASAADQSMASRTNAGDGAYYGQGSQAPSQYFPRGYDQGSMIQQDPFGGGIMSQFDSMRNDMFAGMDSMFARQNDFFQSSMRDMFDGFMGGSLMEQHANGRLFDNMQGRAPGGVTSSYEYRSTSRVMGPDGTVREESVFSKTGPDGVPSTQRVWRDADGTERVTVTRGDRQINGAGTAGLDGFWNDPFYRGTSPHAVAGNPEYDPPQIEELPDDADEDPAATRQQRLLEAPPSVQTPASPETQPTPEPAGRGRLGNMWNSWRSRH